MWKTEPFVLAGGVNVEDPSLKLKPGQLIDASNFECLYGGGYRRIDGYERYDGTVNIPSNGYYLTLGFDAGTATISAGDTVTGNTSGVTAQVLAVVVASGSFGGSDAAGTLVLTYIGNGVAFQDNEDLYVSASPAAVVNGTLTAADVDAVNYKAWLSLAREYVRTLVTEVPSAGDANTQRVTGGFVLNGTVYVWASSTISDVIQPLSLYYADSTGWHLVTLSKYLRFTSGTVEVLEGQTITGATSTATAVVRRVNIGSGNYSGPTFASGRWAIDTVAGDFENGEVINVGGNPVANAIGTQGDSERIVANGHDHVVVTNFFGGSDLIRAYGCGGYDRAWEFDGEIFIFIETGMVDDNPTHIAAHRNHLFLGFAGGSLQNSGTGTPLIWSPRVGAGEIGIGDDITNLDSNGNNTLAITGERSTHILQGTSNLDWTLQNITTDIGSVGNTMQEVGGLLTFLDKAGVNFIMPPQIQGQSYGTNSISRTIRKALVPRAYSAVESQHAIVKNQYRIFFSDKKVLAGTFYGVGQNGAPVLAGWSWSDYDLQVRTVFQGVVDGTERMFMICDDAPTYLFELDVGTSFDGNPVESFIQLPYSYHVAPERDKAWHRLTLECDTPREITLDVTTSFDYGGDGQGDTFSTITVPTSGSNDLPQVELDGVSRNLAFTVSHDDGVDDPFSVSAAMLSYTVRGVHRG